MKRKHKNKDTRIETGDIILVRGNFPIISALIRWFTKSEYTHAALAVTNNWIFEIDMNKDLAIRPLKRHQSYDVFRFKGGLTKEQKIKIMQAAEKRAVEHKGYDWLRILSFVFEKFFRTQVTYDRMNKYICSEIVDILYHEAGIDLVPDLPLGDVAPVDLKRSPVLEKVQ